MGEPIAFVDLQAQKRRLEPQLAEAIDQVLEHGQFIMGPEVMELEQQLQQFTGTRHCVSCSSGTDALVLALMALGIGPGDAVVVPSFTFAATASAVAICGATPVFVDSDPRTFNIDPGGIVPGVDAARRAGLEPRAVIPVDLFGMPADYREIHEVADEYGLVVVADAAQSLGARNGDEHAGSLAALTATSFFPAKPFGAYGDGGAVFTDDDDLADRLRSLRVHGKGQHKYDNVRVGLNARLDTMQAAILLVKLKVYPEELELRARVASRYENLLAGSVITPIQPQRKKSTWAQYTIQVPNRNHVVSRLTSSGVPTAIYYPMPLHLQPAYADGVRASPSLPGAEHLAGHVLSLPMHPYLDEPTQNRIVRAVAEAAEREDY